MSVMDMLYENVTPSVTVDIGVCQLNSTAESSMSGVLVADNGGPNIITCTGFDCNILFGSHPPNGPLRVHTPQFTWKGVDRLASVSVILIVRVETGAELEIVIGDVSGGCMVNPYLVKFQNAVPPL
jgi:hypothetical protein